MSTKCLSVFVVSVFLLLSPSFKFQRSGTGRSGLAVQPRLLAAAARAGDQPAAQPSGLQGCGGVDVPPQNAQFEQQVVELVNATRMGQGLPPLKRSPGLTASARFHAADMAQDDYFEHNTFDRQGDRLVEVCDAWARIATFYSAASGENIGAGYRTPADVVNGWMESPSHRDILLDTASMEIGVGFYNFYWVLDFGSGEAPTALVINGERDLAPSPSVSLYVYGSWQDMRLRNDSEGWTDWQSFRPSVTWEINPRPGSHTVSVEVRRDGETASSSDTINLPGEALLLQRRLYLPQMLYTQQPASPNPYP